MPADNEVAKERIWKEHCAKLTNLSIHRNQTSEFTMNPFRLGHNKPVAEPVNVRQSRFLDRNQAALESLAGVLEKSGSSVSPRAAVSQLSAAQANRERAIAGNNIFNSEHSLPRGGPRANPGAAQDWDRLNEELGGSTPSSYSAKKNFAGSQQLLSGAGKSDASSSWLQKNAVEENTKASRDEAVQQMLVRASQVPTDKYPQPILESHELGWDVKGSKKPLPQFSFARARCEITKFQELSGTAPKRSTKKE
jgi:hypothetical protein